MIYFETILIYVEAESSKFLLNFLISSGLKNGCSNISKAMNRHPKGKLRIFGHPNWRVFQLIAYENHLHRFLVGLKRQFVDFCLYIHRNMNDTLKKVV